MSSIAPTQPHLTKMRIAQIEAEARELQREVWARHFKGCHPDHVDALEPGLAIAHVGYRVITVDTLGVYAGLGRSSEIAGRINRFERTVEISRRFSSLERRFTTGHELGHAVMQPRGEAIHRDLPISGPTPRRSLDEMEADRFSSAYLISARRLEEHFEFRFGVDRIARSDASMSYIFGKAAVAAAGKIRNQRDFSMHLASVKNFRGRNFKALYEQFHVSRTTMAIRLEELEIVSARN